MGEKANPITQNNFCHNIIMLLKSVYLETLTSHNGAYQEIGDRHSLSHLNRYQHNVLYVWKVTIILQISFYNSVWSKIVDQHLFLQICSYQIISK